MELTALKGIGPKRAALFARLGLLSVEALLLDFPIRYEDRSKPITVSALTQDTNSERKVVRARLTRLARPVRLGGRRSLLRGAIADATESVEVVWHNQPYRSAGLTIGSDYYFYGSYDAEKNVLYDPQVGMIDDSKAQAFLGIFPVYSLTEGLTNTVRRQAIREALKCRDLVEDPLPVPWQKELGLHPLESLLEALHFPASLAIAQQAQKERLKREALETALLRHFLAKERQQKHSISLPRVSLEAYRERLPFVLTKTQEEAVQTLVTQLVSPQPMNTLLQGDVGSGKTIVAFLAAAHVLENGSGVAFMAPSEVLAQQHAQKARSFFSHPIYLLTGSTPNEERERVERAAREGKPGIFFGTHALFQERVRFSHLGLVITDEQHRFGVRQRAKLQEKLEEPNTLVLSATPIPRTMHLVELGDLDLVRLTDRPPGRGSITTRVVDRRSEGACYRAIAGQIAKGRQAYIVCPLIDSGESDWQYWSVAETLERVRKAMDEEGEKRGRTITVDILTGRQSAADKEEAMARFYRGKTDLLIATTVIEVGIDVANATVMMIAGAERFGLAQLHQLRGRVGRGKENAYCILMLHTAGQSHRERLKILEKTQDGWLIAKEDLLSRGAGERLGTEQHGLFVSEDENLAMREARQQVEDWLTTQKRALDRPEDLPKALGNRLYTLLQRVRTITLN